MLTILKKLIFFITLEQKQAIREHPKKRELYDSFEVLKSNKITKKLEPDFALVCVNTLLHDHEAPEATALIICRLRAIGVLPTIDRVQTYLNKIKNHPKKNSLYCALYIVEELCFPQEITQVFIEALLPDGNTSDYPIQLTNQQHSVKKFSTLPILNQTQDLLVRIAAAPHDIIAALTRLNVCMPKILNLDLPNRLKLTNKVLAHKNVVELEKSFPNLWNKTIYRPCLPLTQVCIDAILQDHKTPKETANIMCWLCFGDVIELETAKTYQNMLASYPNKVYLSSVVSALELNYGKWTKETIKACIQAVLYEQQACSENNNHVNQFLNIINQINITVNEEAYRHLVLLLKKTYTVDGFIEMTKLLQDLEQRGVRILWNKIKIKVIERLSPFVPLNFMRIVMVDRTGKKYPSFEDDFVEVIVNNMSLQLPASLKQQISESSAYAQYCSTILKVSSRFFNQSNMPFKDELLENGYSKKCC